MDVKLIIVGAKAGTKEILVKRPRILGRTKGIGIVIPHPSVSERHCLLFDHAGLLMVQDLNSATGTLIGGRKIIMAPLPPGAEFTVGPLTLRAEYTYSGNLEALPKTLFDEPEVEPAAAPLPAEPVPTTPLPASPEPIAKVVPTIQMGEVDAHREGEAPTEPNTPSPEFPSFFGFESQVEFPSVSQPVVQPEVSFTPPSAPPPAPVAPAPQIVTPIVAVKKPQPQIQPTLPPPLPKPVESPSPTIEQAPNFAEFAASGAVAGAENFEPAAEIDSGIPGLNVDQPISPPQPVQPPPPAKKKSAGSLLDYFSKRPPRRKRVVRIAPDAIAPVANGNSAQPPSGNHAPPASSMPAPPVAKAAWSEEMPQVAAAPSPLVEHPLENNPPPPAEVDDDLSNFFKKLE